MADQGNFDAMALNERIEKAMKTLNDTQQGLADHMGTTFSTEMHHFVDGNYVGYETLDDPYQNWKDHGDRLASLKELVGQIREGGSAFLSTPKGQIAANTIELIAENGQISPEEGVAIEEAVKAIEKAAGIGNVNVTLAGNISLAAMQDTLPALNEVQHAVEGDRTRAAPISPEKAQQMMEDATKSPERM